MLVDESFIIKDMIKGYQNKTIINLGSSDKKFYMKTQPFIWENIIEPLKRARNSVINVDKKYSEGVDLVADSCDLSKKIGDGFADLVLCTNIIEHVIEPIRLIGEINRILTPGGDCILSAPGCYPFHADPIDNTLRFPTKFEWENIFDIYKKCVNSNSSFEIVNYKRTPYKDCPPHYSFDKKVFATVVKIRKKIK